METFNSYFVDIGPDLPASIPENKTSFQNYSLRRSLPQYHQSYGLRTGKCICCLKTNKSLAYDDISADVVKRVSDEIFVILKHIFNISLVKGVFPNKLKITRVIPTFIKGNNTLVTNYRRFQSHPVSRNYLNTKCIIVFINFL